MNPSGERAFECLSYFATNVCCTHLPGSLEEMSQMLWEAFNSGREFERRGGNEAIKRLHGVQREPSDGL